VIRSFCLLLPVVAGLCAALAAADVVVPSERVKSSLSVRAKPVAGSRRLAALRPGDEAEHLASQEGWHQIRLPDGTEGWVSAGWSRRIVVEPPPGTTAPEAPSLEDFTLEAKRSGRGGLWYYLRYAVLAPLGRIARVDLEIREPEMGVTHQHRDPNLPVAGFASAHGSSGRYDIMLALDASTSTSEFAEADVDGDGTREDRWKGSDSIFRAQVTAAIGFVGVLRRLPANREGERIRVGVVTFAGDERFHRIPEGRSFDPTPEAIYGLAKRDAHLVSPLTGDYDALDRALRELLEVEPKGMTDLAAGIGRAVAELTGNIGRGGKSVPRPDAVKVIHLMTDGKPRLPYDRDTAEKAAVRAARMAGAEDIHINVFAMGRNVVTRDVSDALHRVVARSNGRLVELRDPGDIVPILRTTSFAYVDRVQLVNRTRGLESEYISTGIDGSFYGEIDLIEGDNRIEVVALLHDERRASESFRIAYLRVPPEIELEKRLAEIRSENAVLIEEIRERLADQMEAAREEKRRPRQDKIVEVVPELPSAP
jgi:hypothetical protein